MNFALTKYYSQDLKHDKVKYSNHFAKCLNRVAH